jgi:hypothetical protein
LTNYYVDVFSGCSDEGADGWGFGGLAGNLAVVLIVGYCRLAVEECQ